MLNLRMANVGRFLVEENVVYFPLLKKAYNNNVNTAKVLPPAGGEDLGGANKLATDLPTGRQVTQIYTD